MAQRRAAEENFEQPSLSLTGTDGGAALQRLAVEKLAAHRQRRLAIAPHAAVIEEDEFASQPDSAASRVRAAVAERYRRSQSYHDFLETAKAIEPLEAVAPAKPAAVSQNVSRAKVEPRAVAHEESLLSTASVVLHEEQEVVVYAEPAAGLRVRLHPDVPAAVGAPAKLPVAPRALDEHGQNELAELEEEIEFRFAPEFAEHHIEAVPLQANIIEFPRQIVAPRKARPRLAEGPLREAGTTTPNAAHGDLLAADVTPQLRIFEVEPEFIATTPAAVTEAESITQPSWQQGESTDAAVATHNAEVKVLAQDAPVLKSVATLELRLMAACVDGFWVGLGFVAWAAVTGYCAGPSLLGLPHWELGAGAAAAFAVLAVGYALACFTFSDATPGMTYAEIGLCTFEDENPTRAAMRKRLLATAVAAAPLGLGLLWAAMDSERLAWNDRLSRMYLRSY